MIKRSKSFYKFTLCYKLDDLDLNQEKTIANQSIKNKTNGPRKSQLSINKYYMFFRRITFATTRYTHIEYFKAFSWLNHLSFNVVYGNI